jgi:hypothetical protein
MSKESTEDILKDLDLGDDNESSKDDRSLKDDNPFHIRVSSILSFDKLVDYDGPNNISCIDNEHDKIIEDLNESDIEVSESIEKSIIKSLSKEGSSNNSFTANFNSHKYSSPEAKASLESNYVTFGLAQRGRRTNDSSCQPINYSTNDRSDKNEISK